MLKVCCVKRGIKFSRKNRKEIDCNFSIFICGSFVFERWLVIGELFDGGRDGNGINSILFCYKGLMYFIGNFSKKEKEDL